LGNEHSVSSMIPVIIKVTDEITATIVETDTTPQRLRKLQSRAQTLANKARVYANTIASTNPSLPPDTNTLE